MKHICNVGGSPYYGTELEAKTLCLNPGDKILVDGVIRIVKLVWFYDGINVSFEEGQSLYVSMGDTWGKYDG